MTKIQQIFDKIEGRGWNFFGWAKEDLTVFESKIFFHDGMRDSREYSIADLLAEKSWTDACCLTSPQCHTAFTKLRLNGTDNCLDYILKKMK